MIDTMLIINIWYAIWFSNIPIFMSLYCVTNLGSNVWMDALHISFPNTNNVNQYLFIPDDGQQQKSTSNNL